MIESSIFNAQNDSAKKTFGAMTNDGSLMRTSRAPSNGALYIRQLLLSNPPSFFDKEFEAFEARSDLIEKMTIVLA